MPLLTISSVWLSLPLPQYERHLNTAPNVGGGLERKSLSLVLGRDAVTQPCSLCRRRHYRSTMSRGNKGGASSGRTADGRQSGLHQSLSRAFPFCARISRRGKTGASRLRPSDGHRRGSSRFLRGSEPTRALEWREGAGAVWNPAPHKAVLFPLTHPSSPPLLVSLVAPKSSSSNCPDHDHTLTDVGCAKGGRERGIARVVPVRGDEAGKPRPYLSCAVVPSIERGTVLPLAATGHASHVVF